MGDITITNIDNDIMTSEVLDKQEQLRGDITQATEEYISRLLNPEDITKPNVFNGLILHIHTTCICGVHNNFKPLDLNDIPTLYTLWNYYVSACSTYDKTITLVQFSVLLGIHHTTLYRWINNNSRRTTKSHNLFAQNVYNACESATLGRTIDQNSIGAMFALKSVFGYRDSSETIIRVENTANQSADEITAKYTDILEDNAAKIQPRNELSDDLRNAKERAKQQAN